MYSFHFMYVCMYHFCYFFIQKKMSFVIFTICEGKKSYLFLFLRLQVLTSVL